MYHDDDETPQQPAVSSRAAKARRDKPEVPSNDVISEGSSHDSDSHYQVKRRRLAAVSKVHSTWSLKKAPSKLKKAPGAPKRFKSAFIFFSTEKHKEIRARMGKKGLSEKTTTISKLVSEAWRELPPQERVKWETLARNDRARYEVEKTTFNGPWHETKGRKPKDANAPKRPMSAFLAFANSRRGMVKQGMPSASNGDISRALAAMWKDAPNDVRQSYVDAEYKKRQEYKTAISKWKKQNDERMEYQRQEEMQARAATDGADARIGHEESPMSTLVDGQYHPGSPFDVVTRSDINPNFALHEGRKSAFTGGSLPSFEAIGTTFPNSAGQGLSHTDDTTTFAALGQSLPSLLAHRHHAPTAPWPTSQGLSSMLNLPQSTSLYQSMNHFPYLAAIGLRSNPALDLWDIANWVNQEPSFLTLRANHQRAPRIDPSSLNPHLSGTGYQDLLAAREYGSYPFGWRLLDDARHHHRL